MTPTNEQIAETLEALAGEATPGPWMDGGHDDWPSIVTDKNTVVMKGAGKMFNDDRELIVAYRNHHAAIIAALRGVGRMREALEKFAIVSVHRPAQNLTTVHVGYRCDLCDQNGEPVPRDQIKHAPDCALTATGRE